MKPIENFLKVQIRRIDKYLKHFCNVKHVTRQKCFPNGPKPKSSKHLVTEFEYSSWLYYWRINSFRTSRTHFEINPKPFENHGPFFDPSHVEGFENIESQDIDFFTMTLVVLYAARIWPQKWLIFTGMSHSQKGFHESIPTALKLTRFKTIIQNDQRELKCLIFVQN